MSSRREGTAYPLLRELAGALVLAVAEQLDDAALVGGEASWREENVSICSSSKTASPLFKNFPPKSSSRPLKSFNDDKGLDNSVLSHELESKLRRSLTYPETSRTTSRTKVVRLLRRPLGEVRGLATRGVVFCSRRQRRTNRSAYVVHLLQVRGSRRRSRRHLCRRRLGRNGGIRATTWVQRSSKR